MVQSAIVAAQDQRRHSERLQSDRFLKSTSVQQDGAGIPAVMPRNRNDLHTPSAIFAPGDATPSPGLRPSKRRSAVL
jgi:hypothetical protein